LPWKGTPQKITQRALRSVPPPQSSRQTLKHGGVPRESIDERCDEPEAILPRSFPSVVGLRGGSRERILDARGADMNVERASRWRGRAPSSTRWIGCAGALSLVVGCGDVDLQSLLSTWGEHEPGHGQGAGGSGEPAAVWSEPVNLTADGDTPELAIGPDGTVVAVWQKPAAQVSARVELAELGRGESTWRAIAVSGTSGGPYSTPLRVVAGDDDSFELLWHNTGYLYGSVYRPGVGLGAGQRSGERGGNPDGDGAIGAGHTWLASNTFGWVVLSHTSDGATWTRLSGLFLDQFSESNPATSGPRLLTHGAGNTSIFWAQRTGVYTSSFGNGVDPAGWSEPRAIVEEDPAVAGVLLAAGSTLGHALLAWATHEPAGDAGAVSRRGLRFVQLAPDGSVDTSRTGRLDASGNVFSPTLAMSPSGDALLSWVESEGNAGDEDAPGRVWATFRGAAVSSWSTPVPLSSGSAVTARAPAVAFDPSGTAHALWLEVGASGEAQLMAARRSRSRGEFGAAAVLSDAAPPAAEPRSPGHADPRLAVDASGRAVALWVGADGGIWSSTFD
jgi:hypothetical protein